jgi:HK97 gp10 family phage protein
MKVVVSSKIPKITAEVQAQVENVVRTATFLIEGGAKMRAPVDTGFLRSSIQTMFPSNLTGIVNVAAEYGMYVEFGTTRMAARPFLLPAVALTRPKMETMLKRALGS